MSFETMSTKIRVLSTLDYLESEVVTARHLSSSTEDGSNRERISDEGVAIPLSDIKFDLQI